MKTFALIPTNGRASFNNKATVIVNDNISTLISYNTEVASYNHLENKIVVHDYFSATTLTHINSFLNYYGFDTVSKKELEKYYLSN